VNDHLHFDYTTVGHVTLDVLEDGSRRPGGTAFYSALQAARLGRRTLIITQGLPREIDELLEPFRHELALTVLPASATTTLRTFGSGASRTQSMLAWAGPMAQDIQLDTSILHLAPVARESPSDWRGHAAFVGLTPQGLARRWDLGDGEIVHGRPDAAATAVAERCDAIVVNEAERASCAHLIAAAIGARAHAVEHDLTGRGAVVAVTAGSAPITILASGAGAHIHGDETATAGLHELQSVPVPVLAEPVEDLGAGDVFAAAFFIALSEALYPAAAARFAIAAAAVRMCGAGADAIGGRAAIEERLRVTAR
jgi:1D-myo-inositol 3-kinase